MINTMDIEEPPSNMPSDDETNFETIPLEEEPEVQSVVEKPKKAKKPVSQAKLDQLKKAREAKRKKREIQKVKPSPTPAPTPAPTPVKIEQEEGKLSESEEEEIVIVKKKKAKLKTKPKPKKRKKVVFVEESEEEEESSESDTENGDDVYFKRDRQMGMGIPQPSARDVYMTHLQRQMFG